MMPKTFSALICLCLLVTDVDAQVVVANRTIRGKSLISAADLALVDKSMPGGFDNIDEVDGMEARTILYPGQVVRRSDIGPPAVVERNEVVTLYFSNGILTISTEGRALARAGIGDQIRVMNLDSRTTLTGIVTNPGVIRVMP
ncbi:MAG: flagellar basal body P-ring formation protein FlgA [Rhodobacteraceae bacterium]|nr:flagellar basal body P-ring formation protein FlgA [Paracoccaceae bacterium]